MKTVSLIIPVYNEEKRLHKTFKALEKSYSFNGLTFDEVIFVNDGSTDNTLSLLEKYQTSAQLPFPTKIMSYDINKGKGHAIKTGMLEARGDYALLLDADMATPLNELHKFIPLMQLGVNALFGTRKIKEARIAQPQPIHRQILGQVFTQISNLILGTSVSDFTCGFKLFSRKAYTQIFPLSTINAWGYDAEIVFIARLLNLAIYEIPVKWNHIKGSKVSVFKNIFTTLYELALIRVRHALGYYSGAPLSRFSFSSLLSRA